uniref:Uncharacterized protein n=1 Tax=Brassica oleracea TaxID=3712 RepID=A0A3P6AAM3_BRAOL|nr:unnamed protein product [Brassica oleracea]
MRCIRLLKRWDIQMLTFGSPRRDGLLKERRMRSELRRRTRRFIMGTCCGWFRRGKELRRSHLFRLMFTFLLCSMRILNRVRFLRGIMDCFFQMVNRFIMLGCRVISLILSTVPAQLLSRS